MFVRLQVLVRTVNFKDLNMAQIIIPVTVITPTQKVILRVVKNHCAVGVPFVVLWLQNTNKVNKKCSNLESHYAESKTETKIKIV